MKLLSFEIKNYKCIESVVAPECSNLTTFIGRNSDGKTSIFEAVKFIQRIHQSNDEDTLREIVFSFEPKTVGFIEGSTDESIIKTFAKTLLNKEVDEKSTRFVIAGSSGALESYGPMLVYAMMGKKVIIIRDNDTEESSDLKDKMLRLETQYRTQARIDTPILSDDNFYFYPDNVSSIEYKRYFGSYHEVDTAIAIAEKIPKEVIEKYPELVSMINKIVS